MSRPPLRRAAARIRPRTLRARLTCGLVVLLAVGCAAVGLAAVLSLSGFLTNQLDQQLTAAGGRFPASLEHGGRGDPADGGAGGVRADTRRQAPGTFGARLLGGRVTDVAVVRSSGADTAVSLNAADERALAALPTDGRVQDIHLSALHRYRVAALPGHDGDVLVTGLPTAGIEAAVHRLELVSATVFGAVLVVAGVTGALWVRWSLRPLSRVAATAASVTRLPLASGEVALPARVPDADPRTEVGRVGSAFNLMLSHVEDALSQRHASEERLRRFAADASHELRTPVASIRGHAELALRHPGPVPPEITHAVRRVAAESGRMGEMVDDLLLLARLDAGRPLERDPVDLTRLVLDATDDARVAGRGHRWTLDLPEEPVTVCGDRHRLHQAVANLLANARVHTPEGTTVEVGVRDGGDHAVLTVTDDGPGVPEAAQATVFERFARADPRRHPTGGGAGLGLAIVAAVTAAHGGTAEVRSHPGETVFTLRLPHGDGTTARA
ncbi:HAMP domain-containing sensor histidine kinase [Streptomyces sp. NPDC020096]